MIEIKGRTSGLVYSCVNCKHYDLFGERKIRCPHRKNYCNDHRNCKHFEYAYEKGIPFITQCRNCGRDMEVVIDFMLYPRVCQECMGVRKNLVYDLAHFYSKWKHCKMCMFFKRWNEEEYESPGYCVLDAPEHEQSFRGLIVSAHAGTVNGITYFKSISFDEECPYFSAGVLDELM